MKIKLKLLLATLFLVNFVFSQNFHDTQGKLEISGNGQTTYTLPIALPPSIQSVGPTINLSYTSGQMGGIAGQGWNINSISAISRISTRKDIDGFIDGVDFDTNDKLSLDGQRLILVSGNYWADGSIYKTEVLSNSKIELKSSGEFTTYFIVTYPDGSRSWYGYYLGANAFDLTSYYITRFEDVKGNIITYHYNRPTNKRLCIDEIRFSANSNGLTTPLNKIKFTYKTANRKENGYINGVKYEKDELLDYVSVFTNDLLFRKYVITHVTDGQLNYQRVAQIQEFNGDNQPANPVVFDYNTTASSNAESFKYFQNNVSFENIQLSGDFDGDGRLDFVTPYALFKNLFKEGTYPDPPVVFNIPEMRRLAATTISNNKLNQFNSLVAINPSSGATQFKVHNLVDNAMQLDYTKTIAINNTFSSTFEEIFYNNSYTDIENPSIEICQMDVLLNSIKPSTKYYEGDFNGDGVSELLIVNSLNENHKRTLKHYQGRSLNGITVDNSEILDCDVTVTSSGFQTFLLDLNPNSSNVLGTQGFVDLNTLEFNHTKKMYVMDFNGDGKSDIIVFDGQNYKIFTINQLNVAPFNQLELIGQGIIDRYSTTKQILFGDYNGDGKIDIMLPDTEGGSGHFLWHIYYSNPNPSGGSFFVKESHNIVEYWPITSPDDYSSQTHFSSYYSMDINGDGKSDVVRVWRKQFYQQGSINDIDTEWAVFAFANNIGNVAITGNKFTLDYASTHDHGSESSELAVPITSSFRNDGLNRDIAIVDNFSHKVHFIDFTKDIAQDIRITKVTSSGGNIVDEIEYKAMEPDINLNNGMGGLGSFYSSNNSLNYPFIEINRLPNNFLVSKLTNTTNGVSKNQRFKYHGLVVNLGGLGSIGFLKTARSAWDTSDSFARIWNVSENDALLRGANIKSYSQLSTNTIIFNFLNAGDLTGVISSKINQFSASTVNGLYKVQLDSQLEIDYPNNTASEIVYQYEPNYLLPTTVTSKNYSSTFVTPSLQAIGTTIVNNFYDNNPSGIGSNYFIGRLTRTTTSINAYSNQQSSEEKYTYSNNKIIKTEKKGNTTDSVYLTEEFEYDPYGNVIKKTLSAPGSVPVVAPRVTEYTYDATQRYIKTVKDIEGLVSENLVFHPLYGLVMESKNPFGQITKSIYDSWGKRTKVTDYLNKNINYIYSKSGTTYTTTENSDDGSSTKIFADALGRTVKKGKKNLDGQWSYVSIEYDALGRKFRESEPYIGTTPVLWNTSEYDEYSRIKKSISATGLETTLTYGNGVVQATDGLRTTKSVKNANGHMTSAQDNGGIIYYTYYADGSLKTSNFEGTELAMEYDGYGRKTKLTDPSAGMYTYKYNIFGEILEETTPKGKTTYEYDNFGKLLRKTVLGATASDYTNITTNYSYHPTTKKLVKMDVVNPNDGNSTYDYEYTPNDYRLWKTTETTPYAKFIKEITFDEFGRDLTVLYHGTDLASGKATNKKIKNEYQFGVLNQIADAVTNAVLWRANNVNERGQITNGFYGNGIGFNNMYNAHGFPTQMKHEIYDDTLPPVGDSGGFVEAGEPINVLTLTNIFNVQRGNLTSRTTSLFNLTETFEYDNLDRLIEWGSEPENIQNIVFTQGQGLQGFTAVSGATLSNVMSKLRVGTTAASSGAQKLVMSNASLGTRINVSAMINKQTTDKIRVVVVEKQPGTSLVKETVLGFANEGLFQMDYVITQYKDIYVKFEKAPTSNDVGISKFFFVNNVLVNKIRKFQQTYDNKGRIGQSPIGTYEYNNAKKYQNSEVELSPEGVVYYNQHRVQNITYNAFKSPIQIHEESFDKINFTYNTFQSRSSMFYGGFQEDKLLRSKRKHYSADGSIEIKINGGVIEFITYLGGDGYSAPVIYKTNGSSQQEYLYLHRDYLGSIVAITNQAGAIVEKRHFDAWGDVARVSDGNDNSLVGLTILDRGYTGHEHLQSVGLIHMNGRLYDAKVHRFLMPDNFIQDPTNTQNYNRYGYVLNNPLKYNDPSGEELVTLITAVVIGAIISATTYTLTAMYGNVPFSAGGFFKAAFFGALSGAVTYGIGIGFETISGFTNTVCGFWAGAATGASSGFITGIFSTTFNTIISGGSLKIGKIIKGGVIGAIVGGVIGGVRGGLKAQEGESNFWTGKKILNTSNGVGAHSEAAQKIVAKGSIMGKYVGKHENVNVYESSELGNGATSGGLTLPPNRIIVGKGAYALKANAQSGTFDLFQHEFGHILQFRQPFVGYYGFYHVIGPESLLFSATSFSNNYWTETWANFLSSQHSGTLFYDTVRFPIQDISIFNKAKFYIDPLNYILP